MTATDVPTAGPQRVRAWPVLLLAAPAFVAIWTGWVGLGELTGFGVVRPLPGIADNFAINTAITLPIGVEAYAAYALRAWLTPGTPVRARRFAKRSAIGALVLGALGQIAYHLMVAADVTAAPWPITTVVACLPVAVLGMGAALAHLLGAGAGAGEAAPAEQTTGVPESRTAVVTESGTAGPPDRRAVEDVRPAPTGPARPSLPARRPARPTSAARAAPRPDVSDLLPAGRTAATRLAAAGRALTRAALLDELRADGRTCSKARASALLALLRAEQTGPARRPGWAA